MKNKIKFWSLRVATVIMLAFLAYTGGTIVDRVSAATQNVSCENDVCWGGSWIGLCVDAFIPGSGCNRKGFGCDTYTCVELE